jgi:predicted 2-oxoglutarate/Fe(II)-dependent dioxygenase YbiX
MTSEQASKLDLLLIRDFLDNGTRARILAGLTSAPGQAAAVYRDAASGVIDGRMRRATRVTPSPEITESVTRFLLERKPAVEEHFRIDLSDCEDPQFLRYRTGDFFVAHQDGATGLLRSERELLRKISVVIFLSSQSETPEPGRYCGGTLAFHRWEIGAGEDRRVDLSGEPGTLVAFRAELTHEVTPVTHGERYSIACWYR